MRVSAECTPITHCERNAQPLGVGRQLRGLPTRVTRHRGRPVRPAISTPDWRVRTVHPGQDDRAAVGIGEHDEAPLRRVLGRPENRKPGLRRLPLALVGILDGEPHGRPADTAARGEDAPLVVTAVVAVQHHAARRSAHDDDDVVLEHHGQPQAIDVEGLDSWMSETNRIRLSKQGVSTPAG
jgi:hypothetical protein